MPDKKTGYQIYVRVPADEGDSLDSVSKYLEDLAALLTDESKHVTVQLYEEYGDGGGGYSGDGGGAAKPAASTAKKTTSKKVAAKKATGAKKKVAKSEPPAPEGGRNSPLYPMYVCHNKYLSPSKR